MPYLCTDLLPLSDFIAKQQAEFKSIIVRICAAHGAVPCEAPLKELTMILPDTLLLALSSFRE